jgi:hypothetical protein
MPLISHAEHIEDRILICQINYRNFHVNYAILFNFLFIFFPAIFLNVFYIYIIFLLKIHFQNSLRQSDLNTKKIINQKIIFVLTLCIITSAYFFFQIPFKVYETIILIARSPLNVSESFLNFLEKTFIFSRLFFFFNLVAHPIFFNELYFKLSTIFQSYFKSNSGLRNDEQVGLNENNNDLAEESYRDSYDTNRNEVTSNLNSNWVINQIIDHNQNLNV